MLPKVGDTICYYEGCDAVVIAVHERYYGVVLDLILDNGVEVSGYRA